MAGPRRARPRCCTSPLRRARETAAPLAAALGVDGARSSPGVTEYDATSGEYIPIEELRAAKDERWYATIEGRWDDVGGVDPRAFQRQVVPAVEALIDRFAGGRVVVVTHGGVLNVFLAHVLGLETPLWFHPEYTSISRVLAARGGTPQRRHRQRDRPPVRTPRPNGARTMTIRVDTDGPVRVITIDRPEVRNAVDGPTAAAFADAFRAFEADDTASVAVLTGAGGTFCAGADLQAMAGPNANRVAADGDGPMGPTRMLTDKPVRRRGRGLRGGRRARAGVLVRPARRRHATRCSASSVAGGACPSSTAGRCGCPGSSA